MIGMIALAGIIVRNSILLVDFINCRLASRAVRDAKVMRSAAARARKPIVLTAWSGDAGALLHPRRPDLQRARRSR
jgi:multidrug efflux pump subunit AcrB